MTTYSILMPFAPPRPEQLLPYAALTQWSGAHRLWQGQAVLNQPHHAFTYAAAAGFRIPVGLGVALMPLQHPYEAALQAHAVAAATGHSVVAGFGPGAAVFQRSMLGRPYRSPLTAAREYLTVVRGLLGGELVEQDGEYFSCHGKLPAVPRPPIEVGLGVLRPGMARLAGEVADVAITWLTPARYLREVIMPALREGAEAAGRPVPRVVSIVPVALAAPDRNPVALAYASNLGHLQLPHYADMLGRSGIQIDTADPQAGAAALVEGGAFLYGGPEQLTDTFAEYREAGVDEIVLNVTGVLGLHGGQAALRELETILKEVAG
ncbi:LLM class flavin-dependent oxidoreductase [Streptomyces puniciscabiei]|uniref:LLM class flavin-dependent oxidoreductase n=1 Tax=Streptomyces puniciscabiei TaxID=164348 RepID=UPI0006EBA644|nr:LLM class flavin-dependent oxidoreductase [Streptomyces puniciscabiei]